MPSLPHLAVVLQKLGLRAVEDIRDEYGRRMQAKPPTPLFRAIRLALAAAWQEIHKIWGVFTHTLGKERQGEVPHLFKSPIPSPTLDAAAEMGLEVDGGVDPEDCSNITIYRNEDGYLFTPEMLRHPVEHKDGDGKIVGRSTRKGYTIAGGGRYTAAYHANMEQAQELKDEIEAMSLDMVLSDHDKQLLRILTLKLNEERGKRDVV